MSVMWTGVEKFAAALTRVAERTTVEVRAATVEAASEMERVAKQNASGRPGPNVITGTLRRGITHDPVTPWGLGGWQTKVGPTVIYSRRIELGFSGSDSLGRVYRDHGFPYFEPAFRTVAARIPEIMRKHIAAALAG